jgi:predicted nuclease with TOPRIM domain
LQANTTARELQKRVEQLDRINIDIKSKLDETTVMYDTTLRDLRNKQTELQRTTHELEKTRDQKEAVLRENKKMTGQYFIFACIFIM